jgi:hypothetical protein
MKSKGVSGFAIIFIIFIVLVAGYVAYQISRVHFTYGSISEKVDDMAMMGPINSDDFVREQLINQAAEIKVRLMAENIWIDHSVSDSFRVIVEYDDSSSIFGLFYYTRHLVVDKIRPIKVHW